MEGILDILVNMPSFWQQLRSFKHMRALALTCKHLSKLQLNPCCWISMHMDDLPKNVLRHMLVLTPHDLNTVRYTYAGYRSGAHLVQWSDAWAVCMRKHGSVCNLYRHRLQRMRRQAAMQAQMAAKFAQRQVEQDSRAHALTAELRLLQLQPNGVLYNFFVSGAIRQTPAQVAQEIAWRHYVSTCLRNEYRALVERLRAETGMYYHGIHTDARRLIRHSHSPPHPWPWIT